jgi:protein O-GlcNAc transferase
MSDVDNELETGLRHQQAGRLAEAEAHFRNVLARQPNHSRALALLGAVAARAGRLDAAIELISRAAAVEPMVADYHYNLGTLLWRSGNRDLAFKALSEAIRLSPGHAAAHCNIGAFHAELGQFEDAKRALKQATSLQPNFALAFNNLGNVLKELGETPDAIACYRRAVALASGVPHFHSNLLFALNYQTGVSAEQLLAEQRVWSSVHADPLAADRREAAPADPSRRRLRIGYVSPDFRDHAVGRNVLPLLRDSDRSGFEVFCYSNVARPDGLTQWFRSSADAWRDIAAMSDAQAAELVRADRVDVLVDLALHTANNRLLVLARRPAPVQVTFAGYPGGTGMAAIDYRLTDHHLDPPDADRYYVERSIRLPDSFWCYDAFAMQWGMADPPAVGGLPARAKGYTTFGCLNYLAKVNDAVLELWARVLCAVHYSRLLLLAPEGAIRERIGDKMQRLGVDRGRLSFASPRPRPEYLRLYDSMDIGLDTLPYNGHTSSLDSFWMGAPVITLVGDRVVGRAGLSHALNLGLPEWVARSPEEFVAVAMRWADNHDGLAKLRAGMRERFLRSPLADGPRFTRNIEAAYRRMWSERRAPGA